MLKKYIIIDSKSDTFMGYRWLHNPQINDVIILKGIVSDQLKDLTKGRIAHEVLGIYRNVIFTHKISYKEITERIMDELEED